ncbi:hypothetical protein M569_13524, partial [Genlisea aurea]
LLLVLFFLASFAGNAVSRSRTHHPHATATTAVLDVSSAISRTQQLLEAEKNARREKHAVESSSSSSSLSFKLHSRFSVRGGRRRSSGKDYKAVTEARLARDSARVRAIQIRVDLVSLGIRKADLVPLGEEGGVWDEKLAGPVTSGTSQGSGEYFCRVGIGNPPKPTYLVLDTGSDVNWVQCAPCSDCYQQADPIFDPSLSSSFSRLTCETQQCRSLDVSECRNNTCLYEVSYGDGSYTVGDFVMERITFDGSDKVDDVALGCGHTNQGLFVGAAGLIGLGGGALSFPSQIKASSFSYCLVDRDSESSSTLDFDSPLPSDSVAAPLVRNPKISTYYYVDLSGISVGGQSLPIPPETFALTDSGTGGVIIDSGTAVTRLQSDAYSSMRDAFKKGTADLPPANAVSLFDTCYDLSSRKSVEVPTVSFHFSNGKEVKLPAKNYMIPVDSSGTFCFAFAPTSSSLGIIGNVQQQGTRVSYDLANSLVGFSPNKC